MASTRIVSVIGRKQAGKTTLGVALAAEFVRKGRRVGALKYEDDPAATPAEDMDTQRYLTEGHAVRALMESPGNRGMVGQPDAEADPLTLVRRHFDDCDIVIVEGFRTHPIPKIEVHRTAIHPTPLFAPDRDDADQWIAMLTDDRSVRVPFPCFNFSDTAWFTSLAHLAWIRALPLDA